MKTMKRLLARRRIALVAAHFPPEFTAGIEVVVRAQARELAGLGHEVRIVCGTDVPYSGHDVERDLVDGIPVARIPRFVHERGDGRDPCPRIVELVRAECAAVDIVHVHAASTLSCDLVRQLSDALPVVVTLHDHFTTCPRHFRASPVAGLACPTSRELSAAPPDLSACARCVADDLGSMPRADLVSALGRRARSTIDEVRAASLVVFPSLTHRAAMEQALGLQRDVAVVRHGLCIDVPNAACRPRRPFDGLRVLRVLHFGNRAEVKGTLDLVRALRELPAGSVELVLAGREVESGFDTRILAAAGDLPIEIRARYDGLELAEIASRSHVAAFPSRAEESYALVVEEALALGLSAWVADRGAAGEIVAPTGESAVGPGRVLPASDPESWTRAFREVLAFPMMLTRERAAIPARLRTARDAARELEDHYASLLANRP
jgi:glycosyltransferase involved in cell wall biosynthesis